MSQEQLVKEIVLKFKTEGADSAAKVLAGQSSRAGSSGGLLDLKGLNRQIKEIDTVLQKSGKTFGDGMLKTMSNLQQGMKGLFEKELGSQLQKAEDSAKKIKRLTDVISSMQSRGITSGAAYEKAINMRTDQYGRVYGVASNIPEEAIPDLPVGRGTGRRFPPNIPTENIPGNQPGNPPQQGMNFGGLKYSAIAQGIVQLIQSAANQPMNVISNQAVAANPLLRNKRNVYSGNMEDAVTEYLTQATSRGARAGKWKAYGDVGADIAKVGLGVGGIALALSKAGTGAALGSAFGPVGTAVGGLAGLAIGGAGLYMAQSGASGLSSAFLEGGLEANKSANSQRARDSIVNATVYGDLYKNFYQNAQTRFHQQRLMNQSDKDYLNVRTDASNLGFSEDQTAFFRSALGVTGERAADLSHRSMVNALKMNMDISTSNEITANAEKYGKGVTFEGGQALSQTEKMYTSAFKNAMEQGLIPEFEKWINAIGANVGVGGQDLGSIADRYAKYFNVDPATGRVGALQFEQGQKAKSAEDQIFMGGTPLNQMIKGRETIQLLKSHGLKGDDFAKMYNIFMNSNRDQLVQLPAQMDKFGENFGLTDDEMKRFIDKTETGSKKAHGLTKNPFINNLSWMIASGLQSDLGAATALSGPGKIPSTIARPTESDAQRQMDKNLDQLTNLSSGAATLAQTQGQAKLLADQYALIESRLENIARIWNAIVDVSAKTSPDQSRASSQDMANQKSLITNAGSGYPTYTPSNPGPITTGIPNQW